MRSLRLLASLAGIVVSAFVPAQTVTEFPLRKPDASAVGITAGPDGNLWFTEWTQCCSYIGRLTTAGIITEFQIPTTIHGFFDIAAGPDGNLWFTEWTSSRVGRITAGGVVTEFPLPDGITSSGNRIAAGSDGNLWLNAVSSILRVSTAGVVTVFPQPEGIGIGYGLTSGPDGNLWFTTGGFSIGRITTDGLVTLFPLPTADFGAVDITSGPDGNLWFTEGGLGGRYAPPRGRIGRITPAGVVTEFSLPGERVPRHIAVGPDGNLWFTEYLGVIGRITTTGAITEFLIPNSPTPGGPYTGIGPREIVAGPDGNLWFTFDAGGKIGRMTIPSPTDLWLDLGFRADVTWNARSGGESGNGHAVPITTNTGGFWFFDPTNLELVVKVLDGRSINGKWWVFYGSLTNVEFTLTITDTQTGAVRTYFNPQDQLASVADTSAF